MKANKTRPTVCGVGVYLQDKYSIGLIFRGSKFLQIAIFEDFANSLHTHAAHANRHTVVSLSSQLSAKQCLLRRCLSLE